MKSMHVGGWIVGLCALAGGVAVLGGAGTRDSNDRAMVKSLTFTFHTSDMDKAGTDADIYAAVNYKSSTEAGGVVFLLPAQSKDMEKGANDTYTINVSGTRLEGMAIDHIAGITIINGMNHDKPGWHLAAVEVRGTTSDGRGYQLVDTKVARWLDSADKEGPAVCLPLKTPLWFCQRRGDRNRRS